MKFILAPIVSPNWSIPSEFIYDASGVDLGEVIGQRRKKILHLIYYARKSLDPAQKNYTMIEEELLMVVFDFEKF